jgi:hypothetical protein
MFSNLKDSTKNVLDKAAIYLGVILVLNAITITILKQFV